VQKWYVMRSTRHMRYNTTSKFSSHLHINDTMIETMSKIMKQIYIHFYINYQGHDHHS